MRNFRFGKTYKAVAVVLSLILASASLSGCTPKELSPDSGYDSHPWAEYRVDKVSFTPNVPDYTLEEDFSNVIDADRYITDGKFMELLEKNYFVVSDTYFDHFFELYEHNRYQQIPSFVTVDSVLNSFHNQFSFLLKSAEEKKMYGELIDMTYALLKSAEADYEHLKGSAWENAARRNLAYMSVAATLLGLPARSSQPVKLHTDVKDVVDQEVRLIYDGALTADSPVMNIGSPAEPLLEDYSQYIPRGHYGKSDNFKLQSYFRAMMWYGRITFRLSELDEAKSSMLMAYALTNSEAMDRWKVIYDTSAFFAGKSDDLSPLDYQNAARNIAGDSLDYKVLTKLTDENIQSFVDILEKLNHSKINSMPVYDPAIQPDRDAVTVGFRLMGQRYSLDADIFQRLIYREVGENKSGERRMLPKALDIPAAFGSKEAVEILKADGEFEYKDYEKNLKGMQEKIAKIDEKVWVSDLYWAWLYNLKPLTEDVSMAKGYPKFMRNKAWLRKNLNTFLGSWTELKHDTILYSKQVMAEMGGGGDLPEYDDRGYVEPAPLVYARLAALSNMLKDGLKSNGLITPESEENLELLSELCSRLKDISIKELENKTLSEADYDFIREFGGNLEHLWYSTFPEEDRSASLPYENPSMLVADVASAPGEVLTEGLGTLRQISVLVPMGDKLQLTQGLIFAHHEFTVPSAGRMTDKQWIDLVRSDEYYEIPNHPWIYSFYDNTNYLEFIYEDEDFDGYEDAVLY